MATHPTPRKVNTQLQQVIETVLTDRPIAYHPVLAKAVASATAGIFLSQLLYWTPRTQDREGWIYKTQKDIYEETALTRREQETARKKLRSVGVLQEKRAGVPSRLYFRVDMKKMTELLSTGVANDPADIDAEEDPAGSAHDVQNVHRRMDESARQDWRKAPDKKEQKRQTYKETETTTEITTESDDDLCTALEQFGISKKAAYRLTQRYSAAYVLKKLELAQWLVQNGSALVNKNPAGWLCKAIEENYVGPPQYKSEAQLAREEEERKQREQADHQAQEAARQQLHEEQPPEPIADPSLTPAGVWSQALAALREQVPAPSFETWLKDTRLLSLTDRVAQIAVSTSLAVSWLERRLYWGIVRALRDVLQQDVEVHFVTAT